MSKLLLSFILLLVLGSLAVGVVNLIFTVLTRIDVRKSNAPNTTSAPSSAGTTVSGPTSSQQGFKDAANQLLRGLDFSVDPCEDFYAFTCNKYLNNTPIPPNAARIGTYDEAQQMVNNIIAKALDSLDTSMASKTEVLTKHIYDLCLENKKSSETDRSIPIRNQLREDLGGIPMLTDGWKTPKLADLLTVAGLWQNQWMIETIAAAQAGADYGTPEKYALYLSSPSLELPLDYFIKPTFMDQLEEYRQDTIDLFKAFAKNINANDSLVEDEVTKVIQFEVLLAMDVVPRDLQKNSRMLFNNYTLDQLIASYPSLGRAYFNSLLHGYLTKELIGKVDIIVQEPRYFRSLDSIFEDQKFDLRTFANFLSMKYLYANQDFIGGQVAAKVQKVRQTKFDPRKSEAYDFDELSCVSTAQQPMPYGTGYVYLKAVGKEQREKVQANVTEQVKMVIAEFLTNVDTLVWMTDESKQAVKDKAGNLELNVGWPEWFDFDNSQKMDDYHKNYVDLIQESDYFTLMNGLSSAYQQTENLGMLARDKVDRKNFQDSPATVNAWYEPTYNSITIPYAAMNPPYYNYDYPLAYSFAGNGGTIGHELTHGFDSDGVQFGGKGELSNCNWQFCTFLDPKSTTGFLDMASCVISQYSEQCCPLKTGNTHCANGVETQGENIADLGGQLAAFNAYRRFIKEQRNGVEEDRLPGLEGYTGNQVFWISYGFSWCMNQSLPSLTNQLLTNEHAPGSCRVNQVMQDIPEFAADFNCAPKSTLFPPAEKRCKVWTGV